MKIKKSKKYSLERKNMQKYIIELLDLNKNGFYLFDIDNCPVMQKQIMNMEDEVKLYFKYKNARGFRNNSKITCKRPWLSLIRCILSSRYELKYVSDLYKTNNGAVKTMRYYIKPKFKIVVNDDGSVKEKPILKYERKKEKIILPIKLKPKPPKPKRNRFKFGVPEDDPRYYIPYPTK